MRLRALLLAAAVTAASMGIYHSPEKVDATPCSMTVHMDAEARLSFDPDTQRFTGTAKLWEEASDPCCHRILSASLPDELTLITPSGEQDAPEGTVTAVENCMSARRGYTNQNANDRSFSFLSVEIPFDESFRDYGAGEYRLMIPVTFEMQEAYGSYSSGFEFTDWESLIASQKAVTAEGGILKKVICEDPFLEIPPGITSISQHALSASGCREVTIPPGVTSATEAFTNSGITKAIWDRGCTTVCSGIFKESAVLTEIVLREGITVIEDSAFLGCDALRELRLPASLKTIGLYAFQNCTDLRLLEIKSGLTLSAGTTIGSPFRQAGIQKIIVHEGVTNIPPRLYVNAFELEEVYLPDSVTTIGRKAFDGSSGVTLHYAGDESSWNAVSKNGFTPAIIVYGSSFTDNAVTPIVSSCVRSSHQYDQYTLRHL